MGRPAGLAELGGSVKSWLGTHSILHWLCFVLLGFALFFLAFSLPSFSFWRLGALRSSNVIVYPAAVANVQVASNVASFLACLSLPFSSLFARKSWRKRFSSCRDILVQQT